jgi:hypothetical protein
MAPSRLLRNKPFAKALPWLVKHSSASLVEASLRGAIPRVECWIADANLFLQSIGHFILDQLYLYPGQWPLSLILKPGHGCGFYPYAFRGWLSPYLFPGWRCVQALRISYLSQFLYKIGNKLTDALREVCSRRAGYSSRGGYLLPMLNGAPEKSRNAWPNSCARACASK